MQQAPTAQDPSAYDASTREGCLKKLQRLKELGRTLEEQQSTIERQLFHENNNIQAPSRGGGFL